MRMADKLPSAWKIEKALAAWRDAKEVCGDDDAMLADMLGAEGNDPHQLLAQVVRGSLHCERMEDLCSFMLDDIAGRRTRWTTKRAKLRDLAVDLMTTLDERRVVAPDFDMSITRGRDSVIITSEDDLPEMYKKTKVEVVPDRAAILADLKCGVPIRGAEMSNGKPSLIVRRR